MIVMFVRQELKQQNLPSDQQWQLHRVHQSQQQQAGQHLEERQAGQLQEGGHQVGGQPLWYWSQKFKKDGWSQHFQVQ